MPGEIPMMVREALEEEAWKWGMLLVTDLGDEQSYKDVVDQFRPGGRYEFLKRPDDQAASDVVMVGNLKLRDAHWFEKEGERRRRSLRAGLAHLRRRVCADRSRARQRGARPGGFQIRAEQGSGKSPRRMFDPARWSCFRNRCRRSRSFATLITISASMAVAPSLMSHNGVYKFFTAYRVLSYLERVRLPTACARSLGRCSHRDFMDEEIEKPLRRLLEEQKSPGDRFSTTRCSWTRMPSKTHAGHL